jgi:hypothetical protein
LEDWHLNSDDRWLDNVADDAESFPNGFSTMTRVQPVLDMAASFKCAVTGMNTDGGRAK